MSNVCPFLLQVWKQFPRSAAGLVCLLALPEDSHHAKRFDGCLSLTHANLLDLSEIWHNFDSASGTVEISAKCESCTAEFALQASKALPGRSSGLHHLSCAPLPLSCCLQTQSVRAGHISRQLCSATLHLRCRCGQAISGRSDHAICNAPFHGTLLIPGACLA